MDKNLFGQSVQLASAPIHVPTGGSALYTIAGDARKVAELLMKLREEIAYGMADIQADDVHNVQVEVYFGLADEPDFKAVLGDAELKTARAELPEDCVKSGLSMQARNQVIDILHKA